MGNTEINKLNDSLGKPIKTNNVFTREVLVEKCYKGREMSKIFLKRTVGFYPDMHSKLDIKEAQMEEELIELFSKIHISASIKTDKYSLPYNGVVIYKSMLNSDVSYMFRPESAYRKIVAELIEKKIYKIRFYIHIETYEDESNQMAKILGLCGIKYCFRYYAH